MKSLAKSAFWLPGILAVQSASTLPRDASLPGDRPALANMYLDRPAILFDFSLMEAVRAQKDNVPYSSKIRYTNSASALVIHRPPFRVGKPLVTHY